MYWNIFNGKKVCFENQDVKIVLGNPQNQNCSRLLQFLSFAFEASLRMPENTESSGFRSFAREVQTRACHCSI